MKKNFLYLLYFLMIYTKINAIDVLKNPDNELWKLIENSHAKPEKVITPSPATKLDVDALKQAIATNLRDPENLKNTKSAIEQALPQQAPTPQSFTLQPSFKPRVIKKDYFKKKQPRKNVVNARARANFKKLRNSKTAKGKILQRAKNLRNFKNSSPQLYNRMYPPIQNQQNTPVQNQAVREVFPQTNNEQKQIQILLSDNDKFLIKHFPDIPDLLMMEEIEKKAFIAELLSKSPEERAIHIKQLTEQYKAIKKESKQQAEEKETEKKLERQDFEYINNILEKNPNNLLKAKSLISRYLEKKYPGNERFKNQVDDIIYGKYIPGGTKSQSASTPSTDSESDLSFANIKNNLLYLSVACWDLNDPVDLFSSAQFSQKSLSKKNPDEFTENSLEISTQIIKNFLGKYFKENLQDLFNNLHLRKLDSTSFQTNKEKIIKNCINFLIFDLDMPYGMSNFSKENRMRITQAYLESKKEALEWWLKIIISNLMQMISETENFAKLKKMYFEKEDKNQKQVIEEFHDNMLKILHKVYERLESDLYFKDISNIEIPKIREIFLMRMDTIDKTYIKKIIHHVLFHESKQLEVELFWQAIENFMLTMASYKVSSKNFFGAKQTLNITIASNILDKFTEFFEKTTYEDFTSYTENFKNNIQDLINEHRDMWQKEDEQNNNNFLRYRPLRSFFCQAWAQIIEKSHTSLYKDKISKNQLKENLTGLLDCFTSEISSKHLLKQTVKDAESKEKILKTIQQSLEKDKSINPLRKVLEEFIKINSSSLAKIQKNHPSIFYATHWKIPKEIYYQLEKHAALLKLKKGNNFAYLVVNAAHEIIKDEAFTNFFIKECEKIDLLELNSFTSCISMRKLLLGKIKNYIEQTILTKTNWGISLTKFSDILEKISKIILDNATYWCLLFSNHKTTNDKNNLNEENNQTSLISFAEQIKNPKGTVANRILSAISRSELPRTEENKSVRKESALEEMVIDWIKTYATHEDQRALKILLVNSKLILKWVKKIREMHQFSRENAEEPGTKPLEWNLRELMPIKEGILILMEKDSHTIFQFMPNLQSFSKQNSREELIQKVAQEEYDKYEEQKTNQEINEEKPPVLNEKAEAPKPEPLAPDTSIIEPSEKKEIIETKLELPV